MIKLIMTTTESRLLINLQAATEAFDSREILEIGWVNRERNVADALSKQSTCSAMMDLLSKHRLEL